MLIGLMGTGTLAVWLLGKGGDSKNMQAAWFEQLMQMVRKYDPNGTELFVAKAAVIGPACFFATQGLRHHIWDHGVMLTMPVIRASSWGVLGVGAMVVLWLFYDNFICAPQHGRKRFYSIL